MNNPEKTQTQMPLFEREDMQKIGEEQLGGVVGGVLRTPGRGVLQRSNSAPGRLQGNTYPTPHNTPSPTPPPSSSSHSQGDVASIASPDSILDRYVHIH